MWQKASYSAKQEDGELVTAEITVCHGPFWFCWHTVRRLSLVCCYMLGIMDAFVLCTRKDCGFTFVVVKPLGSVLRELNYMSKQGNILHHNCVCAGVNYGPNIVAALVELLVGLISAEERTVIAIRTSLSVPER